MIKTRKGFTLAEVLVTLTIIGVIAALTIPALLQGTNQAEYKTALKKAVATLNQAIVMGIAQTSTDPSNCDNCGSGGNATALAYYFISKLNVISQTTNVSQPYFYTADGMKYTITTASASGACGATTSIDPGTAYCQILVDVNGDKQPGTESSGSGTFRDQYRLIVRSNSVVPGTNSGYTVAINALQQ
jgi:prepilin-type N-terminal cleavage/methylation domain-containing protein